MAEKKMNATTGASGPTATPNPTEGESTNVGSVYAADLVERENKSNTRNQGPTGHAGMMSTDPGTVRQGSRKTGRTG